MTNKLDLTKPLLFDGRPVELLKSNLKGPFPIVVAEEP